MNAGLQATRLNQSRLLPDQPLSAGVMTTSVFVVLSLEGEQLPEGSCGRGAKLVAASAKNL
jgi:hypothetical protein